MLFKFSEIFLILNKLKFYKTKFKILHYLPEFLELNIYFNKVKIKSLRYLLYILLLKYFF